MKLAKKLDEIFNVEHEELYSKGVMLQVIENKKKRMLRLDGATNSVLNKHSIYTGGFWDYLIPLAYAYKRPRMLLIGLGLGTIPYQLHSLLGNRISIDIVELDKNVVMLAKKYALKRIRDRIVIGDGAAYVAATKKKYDIIVLDAYTKGANIPDQFFSERFVEKARGALTREGSLAINYAMHPAGMIKFIGYKKLLKRFFGVYSIKTRALGDTEIILCLKSLKKETLLERIDSRIRKSRANSVLLASYRAIREPQDRAGAGSPTTTGSSRR